MQHGIARTELVHGHQTVEVPSVGDRPPRQFTRRDIAEILEPRVEEMFDLVKREIVRAGYEGMLGAGVVITGGTSLLEGMPDAAEQGLNLPARRGMPTGIGGLRDIVSNPMHATGVGLLLHARQHADNLEAAGMRHGKGLGKSIRSHAIVDVRVFLTVADGMMPQPRHRTRRCHDVFISGRASITRPHQGDRCRVGPAAMPSIP